ncbi:hypothetical protein NDN08_004528 [Rhodosorus marinus]|uniref:DUF1365 domain-containing protein n=1 Tax=Rhodosorus marinus TaxID=101924 RepID=A0AAV8ULI6_9RHOD|nr:hypothetical protein NDN08_004528 [Rhodosorus marinus]
MKNLKSCIYEGTTTHRRAAPKLNKFTYDVFMVYLDLDELKRGDLDMWPWFSSRSKFAFSELRTGDHMAMGNLQHVDSKVREEVKRVTGKLPKGPVRLLTNLRYLGFCFNPVSFYYVFDERGERVEAIVMEVGNIPWLEQHLYTAVRSDGASQECSATMVEFGEQCKDFHVSPFIKMEDIVYKWNFNDPSEKLLVNISLQDKGANFFYADLKLQRRPFTAAQMIKQLVLRPVYTVKVVLAIHYEAIKLYRKELEFVPHPDGTETGASRAIEKVAKIFFRIRETLDPMLGSNKIKGH